MGNFHFHFSNIFQGTSSGGSTGPKVKKNPSPKAPPSSADPSSSTCDLLKKYYEEHEQDEWEPYYQRAGFDAQVEEAEVQMAFQRAMNVYFRPSEETSCIAVNTHHYLAVWERWQSGVSPKF